MARNRRDPSAAAPVSVVDPANTGRQRFYRQSYDKSVDAVTTLFGCEPMAEIGETAVPADNHWCSAIAGSTPGRPLGRPEATGATPENLDARFLAAGLEAVKVRRIVGTDRYVLHRAYPSPRGMFGVDLELVDPVGSRRLEPWGPYTTEVQGSEADPQHAGGRPLLRLLPKPERFPFAYGSLRPSLALLEAGHLLATVGAAIFQSGLEAEIGFGRTSHGSSAGTRDSVAWAACGSDKSSLTKADVPSLSIGPREHAQLVRMASGDSQPGFAASATFEDWLGLRSSGSSHANLVTSGSIDDSVEAATDAVVGAALAAASHLLPNPKALLVHKIKLEDNSMTSKTTTEFGSAGSRGPAVALNGTANAPFSSGLGYCWSVDFAAWERHYGDQAETVLHVLLGWLCQWVCLGAAARSTTARPARNFDEAEWGQALRLSAEHVPGYQVWLRPAPKAEQVQGIWTTYGRKA